MSYLDKLFGLQGKVAVVIGGSGVLGGSMATALGQAGAKVAVLYHSNSDGAENHKKAIEDNGGEAITVQADTSDKASLTAARDSILDAFGRVDILVNAPGINSTTPVFDIDEDEWNTILDVNLKGVFYASRVFGKQMIEQGGGSIINISSASSETPLSKVFTYSISKSGMNNMTKFLAREWAEDNVRVNAVAPGFFPAEQNREILTEERTNSIFNHTPMNRFGEPEELSGAVVWLASENASSFVTGSLIYVDGGFTAQTI
ncbi:MAG: SDR family oxidoreductase [Candidatus Marinimicrobia bacterium]|nr:SDR family oxidoreductase [Candidatus Neomarinimicrobiota bacterium]MCF7827393.1 SDR family oxidoreductase [Candidatus Neomarinimicrobiota bacterium]MCF7881374.1 SDR family oxidoreductase [Candidatus Neomarinimicrobiota bacterium]